MFRSIKLPAWLCGSFAIVLSAAAEKPPVQIVADATFLSQYVAHGLALSNDGPVIQGTVIANHVLIPNLELGYIYSYTLDRDDKIWDETGPGVILRVKVHHGFAG